MRAVFADTSYWIALLSPEDSLHRKARALSESLGSARVITSEMVLTEFLNDCGQRGAALRRAAAFMIRQLRRKVEVLIVPQTSAQFQEALALYAQRDDKRWSLTDCASFQIMRHDRMIQALTYDRHFEQAGFQALLRG
jgi:predicted nucleic acid-binding protein